jgi:hypothetical protein
MESNGPAKGGRAGWLRLTDVAGRQHGLITRAEASSLLTRHQFESKVRLGQLLIAAHGVWRIAGAPQTWRQRVMAACLAVGPPVAASHATAARLWRLEGIAPTGPQASLHLVVPPNRSGKNIAGAIVHRAPLTDGEIGERWDIPLTAVARTLADIAGYVTAGVLSRATDDALRRRLITPVDLARLRTQKRQTAGAVALNQVLDQRVGRALGDSEWEDRVYGWIVGAGLPAPVRQHQVVLACGVAILDMAYPERMIGIEFDGWHWHAGRRRFDRDRVRASELALAGWTTIIVTSSQSEYEVTSRVRRALAAVS